MKGLLNVVVLAGMALVSHGHEHTRLDKATQTTPVSKVTATTYAWEKPIQLDVSPRYEREVTDGDIILESALISQDNDMSITEDTIRLLRSTNCEENEQTVTVVMNTDAYPTENSWQIRDQEGISVVIESVGFYEIKRHKYTETVCVPFGCHEFLMIDEHGDGMTHDGSYYVFVDGKNLTLPGNFKSSSEKTRFGGSDCTPSCSNDEMNLRFMSWREVSSKDISLEIRNAVTGDVVTSFVSEYFFIDYERCVPKACYVVRIENSAFYKLYHGEENEEYYNMYNAVELKIGCTSTPKPFFSSTTPPTLTSTQPSGTTATPSASPSEAPTATPSETVSETPSVPPSLKPTVSPTDFTIPVPISCNEKKCKGKRCGKKKWKSKCSGCNVCICMKNCTKSSWSVRKIKKRCKKQRCSGCPLCPESK